MQTYLGDDCVFPYISTMSPCFPNLLRFPTWNWYEGNTLQQTRLLGKTLLFRRHNKHEKTGKPCTRSSREHPWAKFYQCRKLYWKPSWTTSVLSCFLWKTSVFRVKPPCFIIFPGFCQLLPCRKTFKKLPGCWATPATSSTPSPAVRPRKRTSMPGPWSWVWRNCGRVSGSRRSRGDFGGFQMSPWSWATVTWLMMIIYIIIYI